VDLPYKSQSIGLVVKSHQIHRTGYRNTRIQRPSVSIDPLLPVVGDRKIPVAIVKSHDTPTHFFHGDEKNLAHDYVPESLIR
jgi:hypothetical protein